MQPLLQLTMKPLLLGIRTQQRHGNRGKKGQRDGDERRVAERERRTRVLQDIDLDASSDVPAFASLPPTSTIRGAA